MTVSIDYTDGFVSITAVGGETSLDFDFPIFAKAHLRIIRTRSGVSTTLALNTDYTIADGELSQEAGGTAVLVSPAVAADVYTLLLDVPEERTTDFNQAGDFLADTLNRELDLQTQMIQALRRDSDKSARLPDTSTITTLTLPTPEANKLIGWNSGANGIANYAVTDLSGTVVSSFIETLLDDTTATEARTTLNALSGTIKATARPSSIVAAQSWADDNTPSATVWTDNIYDGTDDIARGFIDTTNNVYLPGSIGAGTNTIASAATVNLGSVPETSITISGTTTITSFGTSMKAGQAKIVTFSGALTLTHNGTSLILPAGANITTAAGDQALVHCLSSGNYRVLYQRANGRPVSLGSVVQVVNTQTGAVATGTTQIPSDDTIPQNTEGDEYMTLAITPTSAASKLKIEVVYNGTHSAISRNTVALFQDSTANALAAAQFVSPTAGYEGQCVFTHYMTAGTTSATTFKVRAGGNTAGTTTFNGTAGARRFGGVCASSITITEISA